MRSDVGSIVATDNGVALVQALYAECLAVAEAAGQPVPEKARQIALKSLTQPGSTMKASMLRDLEAGQPVEAAHIVGDMLARAGKAGIATPLLQAAWCHLQVYEQQRRAG
jgi:Ketopantoate reductase